MCERGYGDTGIRGYDETRVEMMMVTRGRDRIIAAMQDPKNLAVYRLAVPLAVSVYRLTDHFPSQERFSLTAQMRRASVSVGSNIAEGCGRWGNRELLQFLQMAYSSTCELSFQSEVAKELGFGSVVDRGQVAEHTDHVKRMLSRLIAAKRARDTNAEHRPATRASRSRG
jgi:four helix bundle protein